MTQQIVTKRETEKKLLDLLIDFLLLIVILFYFCSTNYATSLCITRKVKWKKGWQKLNNKYSLMKSASDVCVCVRILQRGNDNLRLNCPKFVSCCACKMILMRWWWWCMYVPYSNLYLNSMVYIKTNMFV